MKTNPNNPISAIGDGTKFAGLTKREYFAAMAMQGLCSDAAMPINKTASIAVKLADDLIAELNKAE